MRNHEALKFRVVVARVAELIMVLGCVWLACVMVMTSHAIVSGVYASCGLKLPVLTRAAWELNAAGLPWITGFRERLLQARSDRQGGKG